jgi:hypothetical protein
MSTNGTRGANSRDELASALVTYIQVKEAGSKVVDIAVDIATRKNLTTRPARAVKAGSAEEPTCGRRALRARTESKDTLDEAGPSGPACTRLCLSLPKGGQAGVSRGSPGRDGAGVCRTDSATV